MTIVMMVLLKEGFPETANECFEMFEQDRLVALLRLDIVSVVVLPFYYLLFFSLYQALKGGGEIVSRMAVFCTLAGVTLFVSRINLISIVNAADQYHATTSPELQRQLLAAVQGMLAGNMWVNTGAIAGGILIESGAILFSILMLKTDVFRRVVGWVGVSTHGFDLLSTILGLVVAQAKDVFTMVAGPLYLVWFGLVAARLLSLGGAGAGRDVASRSAAAT